MTSGGIVYIKIVAAAVAAAKAAAAVGLQAVWQKCRPSKGGGSVGVGALRLPLDALAHLFLSARDEAKQEEQNW